MFQNRVFVLSILALLAILMFSTVLPVSATSSPAIPQQIVGEAEAWTISGTILDASTAPLEGVVLSYDNGTKTVTTNASGFYSFLVLDGSSHTVIPAKEGYTFVPASKDYAGVSADQTNQNYVGTFVATPTTTLTATAAITTTPTITATRTQTGTKTLTPTRTATPTTPSGFSKIYPWDGAGNLNKASVTFSWKAYSPAPDKYRYCVDKVDNDICDSSGGFTSISGTSFTLSNLAESTTYHWHIQAVDCTNADCTTKTIIDTNDGEWWSFSTGAVPTITPTRTRTRTLTPTRVPTKTVTRTPTVTPVRFVAASNGAYDGWILESSENSNVGGTMSVAATTFVVGDHASKRQYRAILSFNTSALPDGATIQSAMLRIKPSGTSSGTNPFSVLGGLRVDIYKGSFGTSDNLALEDFNASASRANVGAFNPTPSNGLYSATLNAFGRNNINLAGLTQFRLYFTVDDNNNAIADFMRFASGEAATGKPVLIITYNP